MKDLEIEKYKDMEMVRLIDREGQRDDETVRWRVREDWKEK
jgi:hypothetical protein